MTEMNQDIQEKFVMYQLLNQRLEEIKQQVPIIQQKMIEFETTKLALVELKEAKEENDLLIPLGSGFFASGKSVSDKKILVDLGAGIYAKKSPEDAAIYIEKRKKEIDDATQMLQMEANVIASKINELVPELQQAAQQQNESGEAAG